MAAPTSFLNCDLSNTCDEFELTLNHVVGAKSLTSTLCPDRLRAIADARPAIPAPTIPISIFKPSTKMIWTSGTNVASFFGLITDRDREASHGASTRASNSLCSVQLGS